MPFDFAYLRFKEFSSLLKSKIGSDQDAVLHPLEENSEILSLLSNIQDKAESLSVLAKLTEQLYAGDIGKETFVHRVKQHEAQESANQGTFLLSNPINPVPLASVSHDVMSKLTNAQHDFMRTIKFEVATIAKYLIDGAEVTIVEQNEVPESPPYALEVVGNPGFWIDCFNTPEEAREISQKIGLKIKETQSLLPIYQ